MSYTIYTIYGKSMYDLGDKTIFIYYYYWQVHYMIVGVLID